MPVRTAPAAGTSFTARRWPSTPSALRTWGGQHAGLWAALLAAGRAVEVVVVGRNAERLTAAARVLDSWVSTPAVVDAHCETAAARVAEQVRRDEEIASVRAAIATLDGAALAAYGGLNGAVPGAPRWRPPRPRPVG